MSPKHSNLLTVFLAIACLCRFVFGDSSPNELNVCAPANLVLVTNKTRACRCFENSFSDGQFWIGCTRDSMPNISAALGSLRTVTTIEKLWLWDNVIPIVPGNFFEKMKIRPRKLVIENSMLRIFRSDALDSLGEQLQSLELKNNIIEDLRSDYFKQLKKLNRLDLSGNRISKLDSACLGNISSLSILALYNNHISRIQDFAFRGLPNLRSLSLFDNFLTTISRHTFSGLENLESLDLERNRIVSIEDGAFSSLKMLRYLHLGGNQLSSINLADLPSLEKLFLNNNSFVDLTAVRLKQLDRLRILNLDRNKLTSLPPNYFNALRSVEILSLTQNRISELHSDSLAHLHKLRTLSLQNNSISVVPPRLFHAASNLSDVFLSQNRLTSLDASVVAGLRNAQVLSVAYNKLSSIALDTFEQLCSLQKLYINDNLLQTLDADVLKPIEKQLFVLDFSDNPWNCDCRLYGLLSWIKSHLDQVLALENFNCVQGNFSEALEQLTISGCGDSIVYSTSGAWVTIIGTILGIVSLLILGCIVLLYVQDHRTLVLKNSPLKRVPSDMVDLIPKRHHPKCGGTG